VQSFGVQAPSDFQAKDTLLKHVPDRLGLSWPATRPPGSESKYIFNSVFCARSGAVNPRQFAPMRKGFKIPIPGERKTCVSSCSTAASAGGALAPSTHKPGSPPRATGQASTGLMRGLPHLGWPKEARPYPPVPLSCSRLGFGAAGQRASRPTLALLIPLPPLPSLTSSQSLASTAHSRTGQGIAQTPSLWCTRWEGLGRVRAQRLPPWPPQHH